MWAASEQDWITYEDESIQIEFRSIRVSIWRFLRQGSLWIFILRNCLKVWSSRSRYVSGGVKRKVINLPPAILYFLEQIQFLLRSCRRLMWFSLLICSAASLFSLGAPRAGFKPSNLIRSTLVMRLLQPLRGWSGGNECRLSYSSRVRDVAKLDRICHQSFIGECFDGDKTFRALSLRF